MSTQKPNQNKDITYILILTAVTFCIGIYLIATTTIISKDGVTFIEYAQNLVSDPINTILEGYQHPGYPFLILAVYRIIEAVAAGSSFWGWIYSAQFVSLVFRVLAIIILYLLGKKFIGQKLSFWGMLILILLPKPAKYVSDALSDWPNLFFLATGILLLTHAVSTKKWWLFGLVGIVAGTGYLIRPECAQLIVFGSLWLTLQLFRSNRLINRQKTMSALVLLLVGFAIVSGPYMKLKGAVFPKKNVGKFSTVLSQKDNYEEDSPINSDITFAPLNIAKALGELSANIGDTLMWFFALPLLIGIHKWIKNRKWYEPEKFFLTTLIALNIPLMIWLYCKYGYMSERHTLPLVTFTIFFVPVGLQALASWLQEKSPGKSKTSVTENNGRFWFLTLLVIGISICIPKLLRPVRIEKQGYREAAKWLKNHSDKEDIIAVPDFRISFYAQRKGLIYNDANIPANAVYYVVETRPNKENNEAVSALKSGKLEYEYVGKKNKQVSVAIYRKL